ncbi:MAG: hypothetical protein WC867_05605 [Candidatus Pacearchaeota archaeon]|jgi:hypothetical protein
MDSSGNLHHELKDLDFSKYSRCRIYFNGKVGWGTYWEYKVSEEPFEYEITPEQARFISHFERNLFEEPNTYEQIILNSLPDRLIRRYKNGIDLSSNVQIALYDLIE